MTDHIDTAARKLRRASRQVQAMTTSLSALDGGRCLRAGERLAGRLNRLIDQQATEERTRDDIIDEMAAAAEISRDTVLQILRAEINCPPRPRLEGFAEVLEVSVDSLIQVAEQDGCDYGEDEP